MGTDDEKKLGVPRCKSLSFMVCSNSRFISPGRPMMDLTPSWRILRYSGEQSIKASWKEDEI